MKKLGLILLTSIALCGCDGMGNMERGADWKNQFEKAHLVSAEKCVEIKSWRNYEDGDMVQVTLKNDTVMLGHSNEIILIHGTCPYCK